MRNTVADNGFKTMVKTGAAAVIAAAGLLAASGGAVARETAIYGCPKGYLSLPAEQLKEQVATVRKEDEDALLRALALDELLCSDRAAVRELAVRAAVASADQGLAARALTSVMMARSSLALELQAAEGLQEATYAEIKNRNGVIVIDDIRKRNFDEKTIEFGSGSATIDVSGTVVSYSTRSTSGSFELQADGTLLGRVFIDVVEEPIPALIRLY